MLMSEKASHENHLYNLVCMAACNGEKYIDAQIKSILNQLNEDDRLFISIDPSKDQTKEIVDTFKKQDSRIFALNGPGQGIQKNFEFLLSKAQVYLKKRRDYDPECLQKTLIYLCDQDDLWHKNKIPVVEKFFLQEPINLLVHDCDLIDENGLMLEQSYFELHRTKPGYLDNLVRNSYIGCCMIFRAELLEKILPFPQPIPMHDQWIGLKARQYGRQKWLKEPLISYRRHGKNASDLTHSKLTQMIQWRFQIIKALLQK